MRRAVFLLISICIFFRAEAQMDFRKGYIITKANRVPISSVDDLKRVLSMVDEGLFLTGVYPNGRVVYYGINIEE